MRSKSLRDRATITLGSVLGRGQTRIEARTGRTIASALSGVAWFDLPCGGTGRCGRCMVKAGGGLTPPDEAEARVLGPEALAAGFRLACRAVVVGDATVTLQRGQATAAASEPGKASLQMVDALSLLDGVPGAAAGGEAGDESSDNAGSPAWRPARPYRLAPFAGTLLLTVESPSIESQRDDLSRLRDSLAAVNGERKHDFALEVVRDLPRAVRECDGGLSVVYTGDRIISVEASARGSARGAADGPRTFGIAMDAGTTTLAAYLLDLGNGGRPEVVGALSTTNPQVCRGADVVSRIAHAASSDDGVREMTGLILDGFNRLVMGLCLGAGIEPANVACAAAVGNTCMTSFLVGADPRFLGRAPYVPPFRQALTIRAEEMGLAIHPGAAVWIAPGIAGYVGGDTVAVGAVAMALNPHGTWLAVDIGTNGEVLLNSRGRLLACSTAAGPAFEGREIACGMRAGPGAISDVRISWDSGTPVVTPTVIGGGEPSGLCGSGLIRTIAEMLSLGMIEPGGRLDSDAAPSRELILGYGPAGVPVRLTQKDIRALQLAKAALRTGIDTLLEEAGVEPGEIEEIYLAGAFGNHIRPEDAIDIGLLPPVELSRVKPVGNAAGTGAQLFLLSSEARETACSIAGRAEHVELNTRRSFQDVFLSNFEFPRPAARGVRKGPGR
ncbi:MAG: ASKHA domain-containing protein [Ignavibacteriales bacterium]